MNDDNFLLKFFLMLFSPLILFSSEKPALAVITNAAYYASPVIQKRGFRPSGYFDLAL